MNRMIKLYGYFRSSASYRVRIALNLKKLSHESIAVRLPRGEQRQDEFIHANPAGLVPVLEHGNQRLAQSLSIIEYLDEVFPEPPLLPKAPAARAEVRQAALSIACDIHPLNNLRVLKYFKGPLSLSEEQKNDWARHWITLGFAPLEATLASHASGGRFCFGDTPGLADCCLIPQLFNARRFDVELEAYPRLLEIEQACLQLDAFVRAQPSAQSDAE